jgi:hypothetical protein
MTIYRGSGGVNHEVKQQYRGLSGVNRQIKEQHRGVGGANRKVFAGLWTVSDEGSNIILQDSRRLSMKSSTYTTMKAYRANANGKIRVLYTIEDNWDTGSKARLDVNGVATGPEVFARGWNAANSATATLTIKEGDIIEIKAYTYNPYGQSAAIVTLVQFIGTATGGDGDVFSILT